MRVLITPAGTETALEIYKSISIKEDIEVFGLDTDPFNALSLILGKNHFITHRPFGTDYTDDLFGLVERIGIDWVYPTHDILLPMLANAPKVISSDLAAIKLTENKNNFYDHCTSNHISIPSPFVSFPGFFKPAIGRGSIGASRVDSYDDLAYFRLKYPMYSLREYLPGKEYTVDCLNNLEGKLLGHCIRERINIKRGITHIGKTVKRSDISKLAHQISDTIPGIKGGWFFQVKEDQDEQPRIIEVNLRISGTMCLTRAAGLNIPFLTLQLFNGEKIEVVEDPKEHVLVSRHLTEETIIPSLKDADLVIWDIDNTLVNGTITGSFASDKVCPIPGMIDLLIKLHRKGIAQAICSRNLYLTWKDRVLVHSIFQQHHIPVDLFDEIQINTYAEKKNLISIILTRLHVNPAKDKVVFIDDSYNERLGVAELGITTIDPAGLIKG